MTALKRFVLAALSAPASAFALTVVLLCALHGEPAVSASGDAGPPKAAVETPVLDMSLYDSVMQARNPFPVQIAAGFRNPFRDGAGINPPNGHPPALGMPAVQITRGAPPASTAPQAPVGPLDADGHPLKPFAERYKDWQRKVRDLDRQNAQLAEGAARATLPPSKTVYSVTELDAFGLSGEGGVWLHGNADGRSFTATPGTRFYDATFKGVDDEKQAVFETDGGRTLKLPLASDTKR